MARALQQMGVVVIVGFGVALSCAAQTPMATSNIPRQHWQRPPAVRTLSPVTSSVQMTRPTLQPPRKLPAITLVSQRKRREASVIAASYKPSQSASDNRIPNPLPLGGASLEGSDSEFASARPQPEPPAPTPTRTPTPAIIPTQAMIPVRTEGDLSLLNEPPPFVKYEVQHLPEPRQIPTGDVAEPETIPTPRKVPEPPPLYGHGYVEVPYAEPGPIYEEYSDYPETVSDIPWFDPNQHHFYFKGEYLLWWTKDDTIPVLATTSQPQDFGILGQPTTRALFGGGDLDRDLQHGGRFTVGYWLDCDEALEVSAFFLGQDSQTFQATKDQFPVIGRPFFSLNRGAEFSELLNFPDLVAGDIRIDAPSALWGIEFNFRRNLCCKQACCCPSECAPVPCCNPRTYRLALFGGPRYLDLDERITIEEDVIGLSTAADPMLRNQQILVRDSFGTRNQFYGAQIGLDGEIQQGPWSLRLRGAVGIGGTRQTIDIQGSQRFTDLTNGNVQNFNGGLLALPSNSGKSKQNRFSFVPEATLTVSYNLTDNMRAFVGYNVLYWTNVARPGQQIDRVLDETQIPNFRPGGQAATNPMGATRPQVLFQDSDFWVQGINLGFEWRY